MPRLDLVKGAIPEQLDDLGKGRDVASLRPGVGLEGRSRRARPGAKPLEEIQPKRSVSPLGDALRGVLAAHRGRPVAGIVLVTDGRSNAGEDPLRVAESLARLASRSSLSQPGAEEGPRNVRLVEIVASPVVFAATR